MSKRLVSSVLNGAKNVQANRHIQASKRIKSISSRGLEESITPSESATPRRNQMRPYPLDDFLDTVSKIIKAQSTTYRRRLDKIREGERKYGDIESEEKNIVSEKFFKNMYRIGGVGKLRLLTLEGCDMRSYRKAINYGILAKNVSVVECNNETFDDQKKIIDPQSYHRNGFLFDLIHSNEFNGYEAINFDFTCTIKGSDSDYKYPLADIRYALLKCQWKRIEKLIISITFCTRGACVKKDEYKEKLLLPLINSAGYKIEKTISAKSYMRDDKNDPDKKGADMVNFIFILASDSTIDYDNVGFLYKNGRFVGYPK